MRPNHCRSTLIAALPATPRLAALFAVEAFDGIKGKNKQLVIGGLGHKPVEPDVGVLKRLLALGLCEHFYLKFERVHLLSCTSLRSKPRCCDFDGLAVLVNRSRRQLMKCHVEAEHATEFRLAGSRDDSHTPLLSMHYSAGGQFCDGFPYHWTAHVEPFSQVGSCRQLEAFAKTLLKDQIDDPFRDLTCEGDPGDPMGHRMISGHGSALAGTPSGVMCLAYKHRGPSNLICCVMASVDEGPDWRRREQSECALARAQRLSISCRRL